MRIEDLKLPGSGLEIAATGYGDPADTPIVLLHGGGQTRRSWRTTASRLAELGWYAVAVDLRGHGDSGWSPDGNYHLDQFADDIRAISSALHTPPVLVGSSLGGLSSLAAISKDPLAAQGLVLVDVSPFVELEGAERVLEFMSAHPDGFASLEEAAMAVSNYRSKPAVPNADLVPELNGSNSTSDTSNEVAAAGSDAEARPSTPKSSRRGEGLRSNLREVNGRFYWHWDPQIIRANNNGQSPLNQLLEGTDLAVGAANLTLPTLIIRGEKSDVLSPQGVARFLEVVPHAEFTTARNAGHMVVGDDNSRFDEVLADFLERRIRQG